MRDATTRAYYVLKVISVAFGSFFHLPSQGSNGSFAKFVERLSAAAIFLVGAPNFGPAAAAPAAPAPTALLCTHKCKV